MRDLRLNRNLTLRKLADSSHVSLTFLHEVETGKKNASNDILEAIAKGLDVTTAQLIKEIYEYLGGQSSEQVHSVRNKRG